MGKTTVIKNGFVVDGTGSSGFHADVLIENDRVIQIGSDLSGDEVIDATGRVWLLVSLTSTLTMTHKLFGILRSHLRAITVSPLLSQATAAFQLHLRNPKIVH